MGVFKEIEKADGSGVTTFYRLSDVHDTVETDDSEGTATVIDYNAAQNKPSVNGVTLVGNKTSEDLGLQPAGDYITNDEADAKFIDEDELEAKNYVNETRLQEAIANIDHFHREIVNALPVTGQDNVLYMVRKQGSGEDIFNEYIWVGKTASETGYEFIGTTATDLTDYYQKDEVDDLLDGKVDKVNGRGLSEQNYTLSEKTKLAGLHNYDDTELQVKVANLHNYDDTDLQLRVGDLEVKEEADSNAISTIQDALDKKMICIRLVEQGDGWTWMDINGSRLTFDRAQAYLGQENCMLFVEQLENDGKVIPAEYKSETTRIRVLFKDLDSLVHIMTLGEEDLLVEDIITTEDGACDFEVENEAVDFGARLDEFYGNTSQEVIAAEAGTEVVDTSISINDVDTSKENYITLKGSLEEEENILPNGYTRVEYIQSDGTQKITLPYSANYTICEDVQFIDRGNNRQLISLCNGFFTTAQYWGSSEADLIEVGPETAHKLSISTLSRNTIYIKQTGSKIIITCNGQTLERNGSGTLSQFSYCLFGSPESQYVVTKKLYKVEIYNNNNVLVYRGIPCRRNSDGKKGLYDTVEDVFYINETEGGTDFTAGDFYSKNIEVVKGDNNIEIRGSKNIFNKNATPSFTSNASVTVLDSGVKISANTAGTYRYCSYRLSNTLLGKTITLHADFTISGNNDGSIYLFFGNAREIGVATIVNLPSSGSRTFTVPSSFPYNTDRIYLTLYGARTQAAAANDYVEYTNLQLEENSSYSGYADYLGNIYPITLGVENLCDGVNQNVYINQLATQTGIADSNSGLFIPVTGGKYTISTTAIQTRYRVGCANNTPSTTAQAVYAGVNKDNSASTITIDTTGFNYLIVNATDLSKIQIEKGSHANSYNSFGAIPIELYKIGDYQDYIYKKGSNWYLHKEFGKIDLSTLDWSNQGVYARSTSLTGLIKYTPDNRTLGVAVVEKYKLHTGTGMSDATGAYNCFAVDVNAIATNPATNQKGLLYYQLANPTDTLITNSNLVSQLNALYNASLYSSTKIETESNEASPYIDLKYNVVTPSPSPDRPSEIKVVKGNNSIKTVGKNRLNVSRIYTINGGGVNVKSIIQDIKPGSYVLSCANVIKGGTNYPSLRINNDFYRLNPNTNSNITIPDNVTSAYFYSNGTSYQDSAGVTSTVENLMISLDGGDYELYKSQTFPLSLGQIELCKIRNYRDYFYKNIPGASDYSSGRDEGAWYLKKEIGTKILNENSTMSGFSTHSGNFVTSNFVDNDIKRLSADEISCISDKLKGTTIANTWNGNILNSCSLATNGNYIQVCLPNSVASTENELRTWLSNNNILIYYLLSTPTYTKITDPTLLTQLENLQQITQYKHTYIDLIPATDNETPDAQFTYISNAVINASDRILGKDTYWNDEVPTSADLPSNAEEGEIRIVQDTQNVYIYDGYEWIPFDKGGEVDLSNYLAKDNTTAWVPTGAFNPATKKYVDDSVGGVFVPTKTSQLTNDSNFIGKNSNDLTYYYTKTQTYTKSEVDALIGGGGGGGNVSITVSGDTLVITTE